MSGGTFESPSGNGINYDYSSSGFISKYKNKKFIESLGEYTYNASNLETYDEGYNSTLIQNRKKRVIIYTLVN